MSFEYKCTIHQKDDNILQPVVLFIKYIELIAKYTYTYHVLPNIFQYKIQLKRLISPEFEFGTLDSWAQANLHRI